MRTTEYEHLYVFKNNLTGKFILTYWASSQKHKAIFSTYKKAAEALEYFDDAEHISIVEL